ncbi:MAG: PD40 domain-containing protein [Bdellovibrio sp.]|nr:PD40 domain-containing protein [Bdellovibrio sp.]
MSNFSKKNKAAYLKILFFYFINIIVMFGFSSLGIGQEDANTGTVVAVGEAGTIKARMTIVSDGKLDDIKQIISGDFAFYIRTFEVHDSGAAVSSSLSQTIDQTYYSNKGYSYVLQLLRGKNENSVLIKIWDVKGKGLLGESEGVRDSNVRSLAHVLSDYAFQKILNKKSIFKTKMIFVSDIRGTVKNPVKELFIADFDGHNLKQLTHHRGTVLSPSFSYNGKKIVYSLIRGQNIKGRNIDLLIFDVDSQKSEILSSFPGINSGAVFLPGDREILLTTSHSGNAELYKLNIKTKELIQLTNHPAPDVDPSINHDGSLLAFLSGRPGKAEIYLMDPSGMEKDVRRISFVGEFNATPRFSSDGKEIVFSSWINNSFDIFRINSNASGLVRLTKDFGSNEAPVFSPDGEFIAFSSQRVLSLRSAVQNIYIMGRDGEIIGPITSKMGNCSTPRWSNY